MYSASADQSIRIWDVSEKRCLATLCGSTDEVYGLALSPDGTILASASKDGVVALWCAQPKPKESQPAFLSTEGFRSAIAPDSRTIAVPRGGLVQLHALPALHETESISPLGTDVVAAAYSPDGTLIASGANDGQVRVWHVAQRRLVQEVRGHEGPVGGLRFLSDSTRLVSGSYSLSQGGGELILWDARTMKQVAALALPNATLLAVSPDGALALGGDYAGRLSWWDTASQTLLTVVSSHRKRVTGAAFSLDGTRAASIGEDGTVALWDVASRTMVTRFKGHRNAAFGVAFSPDGCRLATGGGTTSDGVKLWDLSTHRELLSLRVQGTFFSFVTFSPDGNWLAVCNSQGQLHLWHAPSQAEIESTEEKRRNG